MALKQGRQPEIRFDLAGPMGFQGISFVPKVVTFKKEAISGTSADDFWAAPAGTFIAQAFIRADEALDTTNATVELGVDDNADALIDATDFDPLTLDASASNIGSATALGAVGLYLPDGDMVRLTITGAPTVGAVSGCIIYFEMEAMIARGVHFPLP
jgi:hypothetical protein